MENLWEFVEKYYPKYNSCDFIAYNNDLQVIVDNEILEDSHAENLLLNIMNENNCNENKAISIAKNLLLISNAEIFEKSINNYIEQKKLENENI